MVDERKRETVSKIDVYVKIGFFLLAVFCLVGTIATDSDVPVIFGFILSCTWSLGKMLQEGLNALESIVKK